MISLGEPWLGHTWKDDGYDGIEECECDECQSYWKARLDESRVGMDEVFARLDEMNERLGPGAVCTRCETLLDEDEDGELSCECSKKYVRENTLLARIIKSRRIRGSSPIGWHSTIPTLVKYLQDRPFPSRLLP